MSVRCSQGHDNPDGSAFCDECGERLTSQSSGGAVGDMQPMGAPPVATMAAAPAAAAKLVVQSDNFVFDMAGMSEAVIGRDDPVSNIRTDFDLTNHGGEEGGVSRVHAKVLNTGGQFLVEDQNSTNFTFINRQKLTPKTPTPIKNGDELRLGRVILLFQTV